MNIDFSKIVNDKIKQMDESGIIQKVIEDGIEEVILKAISDQITGYETKRLIEQQVKSCISESCADIGLAAYNGCVADAVSKIIRGTIAEDLQD